MVEGYRLCLRNPFQDPDLETIRQWLKETKYLNTTIHIYNMEPWKAFIRTILLASLSLATILGGLFWNDILFIGFLLSVSLLLFHTIVIFTTKTIEIESDWLRVYPTRSANLNYLDDIFEYNFLDYRFLNVIKAIKKAHEQNEKKKIKELKKNVVTRKAFRKALGIQPSDDTLGRLSITESISQ